MKYNIEGGINFFEELYKSLDNEEEKNNENVCLITNKPLTEKYVELECKHKFNYVPLYNDLVNHKKKFNYLESNNGKLKLEEIRCPYCRHKQKGVLPYYEELGLQKVNGVNYYDPTEPITTNYYAQYNCKCEYLVQNPNYDAEKPESNTNKKHFDCLHHYGSKISVYNKLDPHKPITYGDTKNYCYTHKKMMIKAYKEQAKLKEKEEKLQAKQKAKEDKEAAKLKEKEDKKQAKQKAKEEKEKTQNELKNIKNVLKKQINEAKNVVLGPSNVTISTEEEENNNILPGCVQILKTGANKGSQCCCKIVAENICGRHFKLKHGIVYNNI